MIKVKNLLDPVEKDDGERLWVEPIGLTRDLQEWCRIDHVMPHLGPPMRWWKWHGDHPDGYECFRAHYHEHLAKSQYKPALQKLACASLRENVTLVHSGDDPEHNTATALQEYLSELEAYCPPDL